VKAARRIVGIGLLLAASLLAQEGREADTGDQFLGWKWANFAILVVALGYLIRKHAPAYFAQRSTEIRQGIADATQTKQDAEARAAAIDRRLANLESEIAKLRSEAHEEISAEGGRISRETMHRLQKIQSQGEQELALMSRSARDELRKFTAELALNLAQRQIRSRMTKDAEDGLVDAFMQDLRRQSPAARN
jgi:F-type H+-transporting ATPase subunit b